MRLPRISIWLPLVGLLASFAGLSVLTYLEIADALEQSIADRKTPDSLLFKKVFTSPAPADVDDEFAKTQIIRNEIISAHQNTRVSVYERMPYGERRLIADNDIDTKERVPASVHQKVMDIVAGWEAEGQSNFLAEGRRLKVDGTEYHFIGQRFPLRRGESTLSGDVILTTNLDTTIARPRAIFIAAKIRTAIVVGFWGVVAIVINVIPVNRLTRQVKSGEVLAVWWWAPQQVATLSAQVETDRASERLARAQAEKAKQQLEDLQKDWRHDLLSNIKGVFDMFELLDIMGFKPEAEYAETFAMAAKAAESCYHLVSETRHLAEADKAFKREQVRVADIFDDLRLKYSQQNVIFAPVESSALVSIDRHEFVGRALVNLINNAIRYSNPLHERIEIIYREKDGFGHFFVKDNGIGISEAGQKKIMDGRGQSVRLNPGIEGSGLGLYSVRRILEMHKGVLTVSSKLGQGSIFIASIPISQ
jgi:signal transduction histidine kinase